MKVYVDGKLIKCNRDIKVIFPIKDDELHFDIFGNEIITEIICGNDVLGTSGAAVRDVYEVMMMGKDPIAVGVDTNGDLLDDGLDEWGG